MNEIELSEKKTLKRKKVMNRVFVGCMAFLMVLLVTSIVISGIYILKDNGHGNIFEFSAVCLMTLWVALVIGYYAWAIYFYNINLGLTDQDWAEIRAQKKIDPTIEERDVNPNKEQTLGLPPGTVRGTLTLTLLVASLAVTIAYMGEESSLRNDVFFIDNFDFFKQAFLMMIAFYFGSKSLEYISKSGKTGEEITERDLGKKPNRMSAENVDITVENIDADNIDIDADMEDSMNPTDSDFNKEGSVG